MTPSIRPLVAGNWKMNGTGESLAELRAIADGFAASGLEQKIDAVICVPATLLSRAAAVVSGSVGIGGQDCHTKESGAHTGDVSAAMLKEAGGEYVIVGHSERRTDHHETDALVRAKAEAAGGAGLIAIICVGETLAQREAGQTLNVVGRQLLGSLPDDVNSETTVIAYEPVWAIGTGKTPTADDVEKVHAFMRSELIARFGTEGAKLRLLYGGSVKPANAVELMGVANVDGALIGGASLKASDFLAICEAYKSL